MQFITRALIVIGVLAGLGYGSYAFGKYVLSARLFGPQSSNSVTTAVAGTLEPPEVEVVPAPQSTVDDSEDAGNAGIAPTRAPRVVATPDTRVEIVPSQDDNNNDGESDANDNGSASDTPRERPTRRPRRRRRTRPTPRPTRRESTTTQAPEQAAPARDLNDDAPTSNDSNNDAPRVELPTPRDNNPAPAPTRRRERRTAPDTEAPRIEIPRREPRAVPTRRRESSPVPVPEGSQGNGNSSPIPIPG